MEEVEKLGFISREGVEDNIVKISNSVVLPPPNC